MKKKLLFVINELSTFFSHRLSLAKAAQRVGYEVHVAAPRSESVDRLTDVGFIYHPIYLDRRGLNPLRECRTVFNLFRLYRSLKPTIVHHVTIKPILYGGIAARLAGVFAVVNAVTGLGYLFISQTKSIKFLRLFSKIGFYLSFHHPNMRVIFQNKDDQKKFIQDRLLPSEIATLIQGSGVSLENFKPLPEPTGDIVVLLATRLLWDKGVSEFVEAARLLRGHDHLKFVVAGDVDEGNLASIPREQLDIWVRQRVVEWWGWQDSIQAAFAKCHVVCLPSYREGTPRVLIEAAACARPIVATDVPGCRDIVIQGENGLLVPPKAPQALATAIEKLTVDNLLRKRMGKRGRQIVEAGFSSYLVNKRTLAVYKTLLSAL